MSTAIKKYVARQETNKTYIDLEVREVAGSQLMLENK
jgi:hypothetical protein